MALWVEKHHGHAGAQYIQSQLDRYRETGETGAVDLWNAVLERYTQLSETPRRTQQ